MTTTISDADLVHAARAGDPGALVTLFERHRAALTATALRALDVRADAQDAVQDAFLIALRRLDDLREPAVVAAWLHAIVRNACRMRLRERRRDQPLGARELTDGLDEAEERLDRLALGAWVWTALEQLPSDLRATVMLRYFARHESYEEIALTLGVPVGTVRSRLNQAKARLGEALLETASSVHVDHVKATEERRRAWQAITAEILSTGRADLYAADCAPDVLVEARSLSYRGRGVEDHRRGVEESAAAGVRLHLTNVVASKDVTIVEGDYENPPHDPTHCPSTHTEVRIHPNGQTERLYLYYPTERRASAPHAL